MTVVACHQLAPRVGDLAGNRAASIAAIRAAAAAGAAVVVLPELVTSGYVFASRAEAAALALGADDPLFGEWAQAAGGAVVVGGFCERGADGRLYNSAVVVEGGAGGGAVRAVYRKTHLWDREKLVFEPGDAPPPVVETAAGRIGVLVCYDLEFPELTRALALRGAELLAVPTNWPLVPRPPGERPPEVGIAMAAARVNRLAIACCDRAGSERGVAWTGGTALISADGWIAADAAAPAARTQPAAAAASPASEPTEQLVVADLDLATARDKRLAEHADALADRRPELYGDVAADRSAVDERERG